MAETRQIGRLTVHFLGDNAAQLAKSFDGSLSRSQSFRDAMAETARTQRHIYVGNSLDDLRDQPGFDGANFNPNSERARNTSAFGKPSGAESYLIVVKNKEHHLIHDGRVFAGSMDLSLVHELLHPTQIMRTLAEIGRTDAPDSEARTQMRAQKIAVELGRKPGQDFPDVLGSGISYEVRLDPTEWQPRSTPSDPAPSIAPMKYDAGTPNFAEPMSLQVDSTSAPRLVRVNGSPSAALPAPSAALPDTQNPWDDRFGNGTSSLGGLTPRNPNAPASPSEPEGPIGLFSGKPMRFLFAPIFQTRTPSDGAPDRRSALDNMIWNGLGSRAFSPDADTAQPLSPDRRISSAFGNVSDSSPNNFGPGLVPPISAPEDSQGPLSLNDAYLEYLRRLSLSQS